MTLDRSVTAAYSPGRLADLVGTMLERATRGNHGTLLPETLPSIVQLGHPVLRMEAQEYTGQLEPEVLEALLEIMRATMHAAPGVGLAAPQIGLPLRLAVLEDTFATDAEIARVRERESLEYFAIINPHYQAVGTRTASFYEGCLSFSGFQAVVERPADLAATYTTPTGETIQRKFHGWQARILAHETDHLDGTVYIDRAMTRSLVGAEEYASRWAGADIAAARAGLGF
ncbi:MAG: peptide deformylase [Arthrobacter sp.]|uniref:peptide deformylase n=1 Tax=unclassified Arthrobacter TaxID=235627 RepID=UPI0026547D99|nr:peptide deformylase [Micrococcaceae bacterium]MDN5823980.1 peptide deformylase [Micrococcaceae bacterium]MDN5878275.1 peptide deformylase [Micrococcaceae bacterium]MDN5885731.1 peptide deformylase [Micrococcaceae bacterium]MDN6169892.1 peptide deformylase [Micrococcaceae bacterium]